MPKTDKEGVIKLTKEDIAKLDELAGDIDRGSKAIKAMKEMDIDVKSLEEKLEWAKKAREVLLKEFV